MSDVIRAVKASWLPLPTEAFDERPKLPKDNYHLAQIAIEASQRLQQRQIDRQIRLGNQASPVVNEPVRTPYPSVPSSITAFTIPVR